MAEFQAELPHAILANSPIQHLKGRQLIHRHHATFVFHQAAQHRAENFARHALQAFAGLLAQLLVFVVEQPQIHLSDSAGGHMAIHPQTAGPPQAPSPDGMRRFIAKSGGEGEFTSQGVTE